MITQSKWLIDVPVATIWTSFNSARELDHEAISNPGNIELWLDGLTYETSLELCNRNLVQTQVLYGQVVIVKEEKDGWMHVIISDQASSKNNDGYPGWVPKAQIIQSENWKIEHSPVAVIKGKRAFLYKSDFQPQLLLSFQTILPVISLDDHWVRVQTPSGEGLLKVEDVNVFDSMKDIPKGSGKDIVAAGKQYLQLPYLWGGMSSFGYDCSGFSYSMCKANGYIIPRDAHDQASAGKRVELEEIEPGDLLYFAYEEGKGDIHHVGIYYGDGKLLHSPNIGKGIEVIELKGTIYEKELCAANRYWQEAEE